MFIQTQGYFEAALTDILHNLVTYTMDSSIFYKYVGNRTEIKHQGGRREGYNPDDYEQLANGVQLF